MPSQLSDVERGYRRQPDEGEGVYNSGLFDPLLRRPEGLMGKLKRTKMKRKCTHFQRNALLASSRHAPPESARPARHP